MTQLHTDLSPTIESFDPMRPREWQRGALFVGGCLFAVGNLLHPLQHNDAAYHTATWKAAHLTIFFSIPLLVLGLPYLHRRMLGRGRDPMSTWSVVATVIGLIGIAPGTIIETFVAPMIGHHGMEELESGGLGAVNAVMGIAYLGGTISLGWALIDAKLRPRWAGPSLIAGAVVLLVVMAATGPVAGVIVIAATMLYGIALSALAATKPAGDLR